MKWTNVFRNVLCCALCIVHCALTSCTDDDSFATSRQALLTFGTDTVKMDTTFANVASRTYAFWVYNHTDDGLRIATVRLRNGNQTGFRVNVDGTYLDNTLGAVATDLEVRRGDSLCVFVELTAKETGQREAQLVEDELVFQLESGVEQRVNLRSYAWDAIRLTDLHVGSDTLIATDKPLVIYGDGISVDSGAVLTLRHTTLYFHDGAGLTVRGTLLTEGVVMRGDRLDHMFDYLPYDRVSGQWRGVSFEGPSKDNQLTDTEIRNAMTAVALDSAAIDTTAQRLTMTRCVVHNAKGDGVSVSNSHIGLYYCQLTNTLGNCLSLKGGIADIDHCTLAQFYPFTASRGAALSFNDSHDLWLMCSNSIVTGYTDDVVMGSHNDTARVFVYRFEDCLLRTPAVADDTVSFKRIQWETAQDSIQGKKHFVTIDERNLIYDFHLDSLSTAQGKGCY